MSYSSDGPPLPIRMGGVELHEFKKTHWMHVEIIGNYNQQES